MNGDGPQPQELICPFWQKKCSEVNPGVVNCNMLMQTMGMPPGGIAPKTMMMCKLDFIIGRLEWIHGIMQQRGPINSKIFPPFGKG